MNPEHGGQWVRRLTALPSRLGVLRFDQGDQRRPGHDQLHLSEEFLAFGLLLGGGELVIRESELLAAQHLSPGLRSLFSRGKAGLSRDSLTSFLIINDAKHKILFFRFFASYGLVRELYNLDAMTDWQILPSS